MTLDLDAIAARAEAATRGPWESDPMRDMEWPHLHDIMAPKARHVSPLCSGLSAEDAEFIAHARTDVPALVAEVRRLRALVGEP